MIFRFGHTMKKTEIDTEKLLTFSLLVSRNEFKNKNTTKKTYISKNL